MRRPGTTEELERTRVLAVRMLREGLTPVQVARVLEVDDQSVRRWDRIDRTRGHDGLLGSKPPGARAKLTDEQKRQLPDLLARPPQHYGLEGWLWTARAVATLIRQQFGVTYHHDHVGYLLRRLGLSYQRPARRAKERDEPAIAAWRTELWPGLLKKTPRPSAPSSSPMKSGS